MERFFYTVSNGSPRCVVVAQDWDDTQDTVRVEFVGYHPDAQQKRGRRPSFDKPVKVSELKALEDQHYEQFSQAWAKVNPEGSN